MKEKIKKYFYNKKIIFSEKSFLEKIFYILINISTISIILFLVWIFSVFIYFSIPNINYDNYIKENLWNSYIQNTSDILSYKNNFPMDFLSEEEERKLLKKSGCNIKSFSYKEIESEWFSDNHRELKINFNCKNGIYGDILQRRYTGDKFNGYGGMRYINLYKRKTNCRISFINSSNAEDDGFCWTKKKGIRLGQ